MIANSLLDIEIADPTNIWNIEMKNYLKLVSALLFMVSLKMAYDNQPDFFFFFLSISLGLISLIESNPPLGKKLTFKTLRSEHWQTTPIGKICEIASLLCLGFYFVLYML